MVAQVPDDTAADLEALLNDDAAAFHDGTGILGNPVYPPARRELQKHGIDCTGHAAHQITRAELDYYDRIYYMDRSNARWLERLFPGQWQEKCRPLLSRDVADPWYTGDFTQTWDDITEGCEKILEELQWD